MIVATVAVILLIVAGWLAMQRIRTLEAQLETSDRERGQLVSQLEALHWQRIANLQMLEGLGEGLLAVNRDHRIIIANRRFLELFSIQPNVLGKPLSEVLRVSHIFDAFDRAIAGEESNRSSISPCAPASSTRRSRCARSRWHRRGLLPPRCSSM